MQFGEGDERVSRDASAREAQLPLGGGELEIAEVQPVHRLMVTAAGAFGNVSWDFQERFKTRGRRVAIMQPCIEQPGATIPL